MLKKLPSPANNYKFLLLTSWLGLVIVGAILLKNESYIVLELVMIVSNFLSTNVYGLALFLFILSIRPLTFIPISIFTTIGGVLFGPILGFIISYIGVLLSSTLAYVVGYRLIKETNPLARLYRRRKLIYKYPFEFLLGLHLTMLPFDLINYGAGISRVPFRPFLIAVMVGMIPGTLSLTLLGASVNLHTILNEGITLQAFDWRYLTLSFLLFVTANGFSYWWRKSHRLK